MTDYAEALRLIRQHMRPGDTVGKMFLRAAKELESMKKPKERCPTCGHTALVYSRLVDPWCKDQWHEAHPHCP